ncbi:MAG: hypothetical protein AUJ52_10925 [Elusimicrobia bacterium CG1_02_63_36]|nr:MAG: hypothetical protein AUJ52_10925 [Elusimicrobia bacterium CG1_02_63_36]
MRTILDQGLIPKEHGAWALLAACLIVGTAASGSEFGGVALLYAAGVFTLFLSRPGFERTLKRGLSAHATGFALACSAAGSLFFLGYAAMLGRWELLWWVVPLVVCAALREVLVRYVGARSLSAHAASVLAMALLIPATAHALSGRLDPRALALGAAGFAYFFGPVFIVRAVLQRTEALHAALYFGVCALAAVVASAVGLIPWILAVPFGARACEAWGCPPAVKNGGPVDLKAVGWSEVGWTTLFLACVFLANG